MGSLLAMVLGVMQLLVASVVAIAIWALLPVNARSTQPDPETYFLAEPAVLVVRCDRTKETREACRVRERMEKVRRKKT